MRFWIHSGWWLLLLPLAMMLACIVMCVLGCRVRSGGCAGCCASRQHTQDNGRS